MRPLLLSVLLLLGCTATQHTVMAQGHPPVDPAPRNFAVCYNVAVPSSSFQPFDLLVLEYAEPPERIREFRKQGKAVLGYLSLGAVDRNRWWYEKLRQAGALGKPNAGFTSTEIDASKPAWSALVTDEIVPEMLDPKRLGFDGIFFDDLDLLFRNGQASQAAAIIAAVRVKYPKAKLMANRGLEFLPKFSKDVDYVLLESCVTAPDQGQLRPASDLAWAIGHFRRGKAANPKLIGCALDYLDSPQAMSAEERSLYIETIQQRHQAEGLLSCVSVSALNVIPVDPPN